MKTVTTWREASARKFNSLSDDEKERYVRARDEAEIRMDLAELVYEARIHAGLSQTQLAERAGTRQSVISAIENGSQVPGFATLSRLAAAMESPLEISFGNQKLVIKARSKHA